MRCIETKSFLKIHVLCVKILTYTWDVLKPFSNSAHFVETSFLTYTWDVLKLELKIWCCKRASSFNLYMRCIETNLTLYLV